MGSHLPTGRVIRRRTRRWLAVGAIAVVLLALPLADASVPTLHSIVSRSGGPVHAPRLGPRPNARPVGGSSPVLQLSANGPGGEPDVAVDRYGTIMVSWMDWGGPLSAPPPGILRYTTSTNRGVSFSSPQALPSSIQQYESDVSIAADPNNGSFWLGYQAQPTACSSASSGVSVTGAWDNGTNLSLPAPTMACAPGRYYDREWLASAPNGTVFQVADVPVGLPEPDLFVARSFDGVHYLAPQVVTTGSYLSVGAAAYNDSLWAIADTSYPGMQCVLYLSDNGGASWAPTAAPLPSACGTGYDPAANIHGADWQFAWGPGGRLLVVYTTDLGVEVTESVDLGSAWSAPRIVSGTVPNGTAFQTPSLATDVVSGEAAIAWLDTRAGHSAWTVYAVSSGDGGATFSGVRQISSGVVGSGPRFWPGDFIGSALTPWGTDAVVWGGNDSAGELVPYLAQVPLATYPVTFLESGLPSGRNWSVTMNGSTVNGSAPSIGYRESNGTDYPFSVGAVPGYTERPASGTVNVTGGPVTVQVVFTRVPGRLEVRSWANVTGTGGGGWYCIIDGTGQLGTYPAWENVSFAAVAQNGSPPYRFAWSFGDGTANVTGPDTDHTYHSYGSWVVNTTVTDAAGATSTSVILLSYEGPNATAPLAVPYCPSSGPPSPTFLGLPLVVGYALLAAFAATVVVAAMVRYRKSKRPLP